MISDARKTINGLQPIEFQTRTDDENFIVMKRRKKNEKNFSSRGTSVGGNDSNNMISPCF